MTIYIVTKKCVPFYLEIEVVLKQNSNKHVSNVRIFYSLHKIQNESENKTKQKNVTLFFFRLLVVIVCKHLNVASY